ncbi:hypothetical protein L6164_000933 [Bauhinia variegata]|uniref:Uncharacterized protein n=1 Tax=Bauhinia variegata TaxID=167791 RepID=A0ACB9QA86_BAUVA|nr:hypothetical protein L6164_000933 [Bauhinia variegata]
MASGSESISLVLQEARQSMERDYEISSSKIQPVPRLFKEGDKYDKYCRPKVISIGPIHHGDPKLKRGEQYKRMWAFMFALDNRQEPDDLHKRVLDNIVDLRDLLLLENQLPYQVLKLLVHDEMEVELKLSMRRFCELQNMFKVKYSSQHRPFLTEPERQKQIVESTGPPSHILDCLYNTVLSFPESGQTMDDLPVRLLDQEQITYRSIRELKASAIQIERIENDALASFSRSKGCFFDTARLRLRPLILDDSTIPILLNLIAYEMCSDFKNDFHISSFIKFLDLLIDDPEDVKELRREGILQHSLGSDKHVSEFFNIIGSGLVQNPHAFPFLNHVMEWHYKNKFRIWMAEAYYTHCRSPLTIIALTAAATLLILTIIQTINSF